MDDHNNKLTPPAIWFCFAGSRPSAPAASRDPPALAPAAEAGAGAGAGASASTRLPGSAAGSEAARGGGRKKTSPAPRGKEGGARALPRPLRPGLPPGRLRSRWALRRGARGGIRGWLAGRPAASRLAPSARGLSHSR